MKLLLHKKWWALILIFVITFLANKTMLDTKIFWCTASENQKNIVEISLLLIIYIIGRWGLSDNKTGWQCQFFNLVYGGSIVIFIILAVIDAFFYNIIFNGKHHRFTSVKYILLNPIAYLFVLLINKFFPKQIA